jgi:sulfate transport system substrate-binding protein
VTFENEAILIEAEVGGDQFEIVYPSLSIAAAPPVAVVDAVVDRRGTRKIAEAYLHFLYAPSGQEIIAEHHLRPRDPAVMARAAHRFPPVATFTVEEELGGWDKVQREHFADGGVFDQISVAR